MIDLMIDIKQQMLIANGYPKNAITKPIMKSMNGTTNAFFTAKASDRYSWSGLISSKDFAIQNNMILTIMKSNPYNTSASKEKGLFATNVVK